VSAEERSKNLVGKAFVEMVPFNVEEIIIF
jgi:hypothetical protein